MTNPLNIVLVEPEIPPNTGSIARLCGATDTVLHLVKPLGFSTDNKHLKRAGLDYWKFVHIVYWDCFDNFLSSVEIEKCYFLTKKVDKPYFEAKFAPGSFLIFGKETKGLPDEILNKYSQKCFSIPMKNSNIRSLNLAMAAGIVLYEAIRQYEQRI